MKKESIEDELIKQAAAVAALSAATYFYKIAIAVLQDKKKEVKKK